MINIFWKHNLDPPLLPYKNLPFGLDFLDVYLRDDYVRSSCNRLLFNGNHFSGIRGNLLTRYVNITIIARVLCTAFS